MTIRIQRVPYQYDELAGRYRAAMKRNLALQAEVNSLRAERIALNELLLEMAGKLDLVEETMKESD